MRMKNLVLLGLFLLLIAAVPLAQAVIDLKRESKVYFLTLFQQSPSEKNLRDFEDKLEQGSYFEQKIRPLFQLGRYRLLGELGEKALRGQSPGWYFYTPGMRYLVEPFYRDLPDAPPTRCKPGEACDPVVVIRDLARQLRGRGIELAVMPVPGKASIHPERLVRGMKPDLAIAAHTRRVMQDLTRQGVAVIDLHRALIDVRAREPSRVLYMEADTHFNGDGARLTAAVAARWVRQRPWFAGLSRHVRYRRRSVTIERPGDVPRMTRIPHEQRLFGTQRVMCHQVSFADGEQQGEPYEEPDEPEQAPVLVLGDSFSRVFETDEPRAAGWIANLAFELQQPIGAIVNDGGASTLVRQQLAQDLDALKGKKLVIWAFVERDIRFGMQGWQLIELWPG